MFLFLKHKFVISTPRTLILRDVTMRKILLLILSLFPLIHTVVYGQDVWLQNHFSPSSGCGLSNSEIVNVLINNNSGGVMPSNTINVTYTVDNGPLTQQLLNSNLLPGASWSFTFNVNANLSACGAHVMKVWVTRAGDPNHLNDTLQWLVQNDCPVVPGTISGAGTVCSGTNSGTLNLTGWMYGTITDWEYSTDNGANWTGTGVNTISYPYLNIPVETIYQVVIDGGLCVDDTSQFATMAVQPVPPAGSLNGSDSLCLENASGTLTLTGTSSPVSFWEYSTDNGTTWTSFTNPAYTYNYNLLTQTTIYRVETNDGVCPAAYSDTAEIYIRPSSNGGFLASDQDLCSGESFLLQVTGFSGAIQQWQSSPDSVTWTPTGTTAPTYMASNLTDTMYYRVIVRNGLCFPDTSNTVMLAVSEITRGTITGPDSLCISSASGAFVLNGASNPVAYWQYSTNNGTTWTTNTNTTTTETFTGLTQSVWYRAFTDDGVCSGYSDTAMLYIEMVSVPGLLTDTDTLCAGDSVVLNLSGYTGTILDWESSFDEVTWTPVGNTLPDYTETNMQDSTYYRVIVQNGICPQDTSNIVPVVVNAIPNAFAGFDTTIIYGNSTLLNGLGGIAGVWMPGASLSDSLITNPIAAPQVTTTYTYIVISLEGCYNSDQVVITVVPYIDSTVFDIKNVITTNGDGYNDTWIIEGLYLNPQTFVAVFNAYGKELYSNSDYQNDWAGTYKGSELPNGTYYYIVRPGGTEDEFKGTLTILGNE